ncbi:hypothetical protein HDU87_004897 [Geranomyces variabilis]|uniref:Uncharacterized protein n=1 Tax=Geranomyces variabilis TaxID=109894 RepID=A0AAD5XLK0_9FUNG|nr:hypothetical protein HDU87_004897 [Geranomyces variabilis]
MLNDDTRRPRSEMGSQPGPMPAYSTNRRMSLQGVLQKSQNRRMSILPQPAEGGSSSYETRRVPEDSSSGYGGRLSSRTSMANSQDPLVARKPGRYDAINTLRSVQAADTRSEALQGTRRSGYEPSFGYGSRDSTMQPHSGYLMPPGHNMNLPSLGSVAPLQKKPGALWDADEADEIGAFRAQQHMRLSVDSSIDDMRKYGQSVQHPGKLMNVLPDEYDREVQTEFDITCNELLNVLGEFETALEEMTIWKDDFLKQTVPSNIKLQLTLLFARLFRSKSDLHEPMFELIKQVRVYSRPWLNKSFSLVELEKDYQRQCHLIDVAIRKMEQMQLQIATVRSEKRVALWERLTHKVMELYPDYAGQFVDEEPIIPPPLIKEPAKDEPNLKSGERTSDVEASDEQLSHASSLSGDSYSDDDGDDKAKGGSDPYGTIKDSIIDYIREERPSWKRIARDLVATFRGLLEDCHPEFHQLLANLHRRPFPRPPRLTYLSIHTHSVIHREPRVPLVRKSWSLPDMRALARREIADADPQMVERTGLRRSNSFGAFQRLTRKGKYHLKQPFHLGLIPKRTASPKKGTKMRETSEAGGMRSEMDGVTGEMDVMARPQEGDAESTSAVEREDENDELESQPDEVFDSEGPLEEIEYMGEIDDEEIEEAVNRFMEERPMTFPAENSGEQPEDGIDALPPEDQPVGERKVSFTLQEIMELTMLHGQQMQLLQFEYEGRIQNLTTEIAERKAAYEEKIDAYEARVDHLQQRSKRIAQAYQKQAKEVAFTDTPRRSSKRASTTRAGSIPSRASRGAGTLSQSASAELPPAPDAEGQTDEDDDSFEEDPALSSRTPSRRNAEDRGDAGSDSRVSSVRSSRRASRSRRSMVHSRQLQSRKEAKQAKLKQKETAAARKRAEKSRYTPVFQSAPFAMSFMDRLRWFTELKLQKRSRIAEKYRRLEIEENEHRLAQYQLLESHAKARSTRGPNALPAEFMPMPGDVPPPKRREVWGQQGITMPWGGRYNVHQGHGKKPVNILNLFDVAMNIDLPHQDS